VPQLRTWSCLAVALVALALPEVGSAQQQSQFPPPNPVQPYYAPQETQPAPPTSADPAEPPASPTPQESSPTTTTIPVAPDPQAPVTPTPSPFDAPVVQPDPDSLRTEPQPPLTENGVRPLALPPTTPPPPQASGVMLDGRPRQGPFLSGPGSLTFVMHHTALGAMGGLFTQGFARDFNFDKGSREAMLAGTLIGAGLGFGAASWWQFNNWTDKPLGYFGMGNSLVGAMFLGGMMDLFAENRDVLAWSSFVGAEAGAWLTAIIGGGQLPLNHGLLVASGAAWSAAAVALLMASIHFSGGKGIAGKTWADTLLIAPGLGATALAISTLRYNPTSGQILRANIFGAGVGAAVLLLSGLVLGGFDQPTPYVLSFLGSAGAITTVSLLWEESVDRTAVSATSSSSRGKPYRNVWW
jgi:hypothetical protein